MWVKKNSSKPKPTTVKNCNVILVFMYPFDGRVRYRYGLDKKA